MNTVPLGVLQQHLVPQLTARDVLSLRQVCRALRGLRLAESCLQLAHHCFGLPVLDWEEHLGVRLALGQDVPLAEEGPVAALCSTVISASLLCSKLARRKLTEAEEAPLDNGYSLLLVSQQEFATPILFLFTPKAMSWTWTADGIHWMPVATDVVSEGRYKGRKPVPANLRVIQVLREEQIVPSLAFARDGKSAFFIISGRLRELISDIHHRVVCVDSAQNALVKKRN